MPDVRPVHRHAASLYGPHGPVNGLQGPTPRPLSTRMAWKAEPAVPQSITEHITSTVGKPSNLIWKERLRPEGRV